MNTDLMRMIFNARRNSFIALILLVFVNAGLYIYYAGYLDPRVNALQTLWADKRLTSASGAILDTAAVYRQGTADLAAFRSRMPLKKEFVQFIGELFEAAANNSLRVGAITYIPSQLKGEKLITFSIGLHISGKYAAIKSFVSDMERIRQIAVIDNISLKGKSDEESVDMKIQMTAYFRAEG